MKEIWKDIKGYEGLYKISNLGKIKSLSRPRNKYQFIEEHILKTRLTHRGYELVSLSKDGKLKSFYVHRLVAQTFIENPEKKSCVNHINGIKIDNQVNNLEWCSYSENMNHAYGTGLHQ